MKPVKTRKEMENYIGKTGNFSYDRDKDQEKSIKEQAAELLKKSHAMFYGKKDKNKWE